MHVPGFWHSVHLSIWIGLATTLISFVIVIGFFAAFWDAPFFAHITRFISPLMSVPHAAAAFGFAFLFAPSGWLVRLFRHGRQVRSAARLLIINDPMGYALLAGLVLKEIPFLFLMSLSAASQIKVDQRLKLSRSMGYGRLWGLDSRDHASFLSPDPVADFCGDCVFQLCRGCRTYSGGQTCRQACLFKSCVG